MNDRVRVMVQLEDGQKEKIENCIKESYPKLKNTSEVLREALREFLNRVALSKGEIKASNTGEKPCQTASI